MKLKQIFLICLKIFLNNIKRIFNKFRFILTIRSLTNITTANVLHVIHLFGKVFFKLDNRQIVGVVAEILDAVADVVVVAAADAVDDNALNVAWQVTAVMICSALALTLACTMTATSDLTVERLATLLASRLTTTKARSSVAGMILVPEMEHNCCDDEIDHHDRRRSRIRRSRRCHRCFQRCDAVVSHFLLSTNVQILRRHRRHSQNHVGQEEEEDRRLQDLR